MTDAQFLPFSSYSVVGSDAVRLGPASNKIPRSAFAKKLDRAVAVKDRASLFPPGIFPSQFSAISGPNSTFGSVNGSTCEGFFGSSVSSIGGIFGACGVPAPFQDIPFVSSQAFTIVTRVVLYLENILLVAKPVIEIRRHAGKGKSEPRRGGDRRGRFRAANWWFHTLNRRRAAFGSTGGRSCQQLEEISNVGARDPAAHRSRPAGDKLGSLSKLPQ